MNAKQETHQQRYMRLGHAVLSGVGFDMDTKDREPKHLRHGINMAMCDHAALVNILIDKGILTQEEYYKSLADTVQREVDTYEAKLKAQQGGKTEITLL